VGACDGVVCEEPGVEASRKKLLELEENILSASLTFAFRLPVVPAPLVVDVKATPLM
jgi:hypothetical protein